MVEDNDVSHDLKSMVASGLVSEIIQVKVDDKIVVGPIDKRDGWRELADVAGRIMSSEIKMEVMIPDEPSGDSNVEPDAQDDLAEDAVDSDDDVDADILTTDENHGELEEGKDSTIDEGLGKSDSRPGRRRKKKRKI